MISRHRNINLRRASIRNFGQNPVQCVIKNAREMPDWVDLSSPDSISRLEAEDKADLESIVCHYTSADSFLGIAGNKELWATNTFYLNDTEETRYVANLYIDSSPHLQVDESARRKIEFWLTHYFPYRAPANIYVCCFSSLLDSLAQWRAYAPKGGLALGRVDGFNQDHAASEVHDCLVARGGFLASHGDALEPLQLAHGLLDPGSRFVERFGEEFRPVLGVLSVRDDWQNTALTACSPVCG